MAPNKGRRRVRRVQRVKHGFLTLIDAVPLTKKGQQILKLLGAGNPASVVAKAVSCSRSNVSYWKSKFLSIGALRLQVRDVVHIYRLTPYGSKILTISEGFFLRFVVWRIMLLSLGYYNGKLCLWIGGGWGVLGIGRSWV